ncbi:nucleoside-diphosphate-sugar epimerase [Salinibacter ruber]|uniref:NAD-dependent epimerase/dehydratase family protein n=1 Tax=Salinibacter ruber TaxID=146919 RepID=UPI002169F3DC|nr:NAD-dependent epimerase/dehydratase family protein [Salinibacter ruber]MCS4193428.1 nucleoside-diphosphate-sugar epimerase [Salinibacter ruber]
MRIVVTGSAGLVGTNLIPSLKNRGHEIVGVDRQSGTPNVADHIVHGDLADADVRREAMENADAIFHLAAAKDDWGIDDDTFFFENLEVTQRLIEDARERDIHDWVFYSSVAAMGPGDEPRSEEASLEPDGAYGTSKMKAERLFRDYAKEVPEMSCVILRPSIIFGPGHFSYTNVHRLIEAIRGSRFLMVGEGQAIKTTSYIENVIAATLYLWERRKKGVQTYIYVDEPVRTTEELVADVYRLLRKRRPGVRIPLGLARSIAWVADVAAEWTGINFPITAARIEKFNTSTNYDASAIREEGFEQPVEIEEALEKTVNWHLENVN